MKKVLVDKKAAEELISGFQKIFEKLHGVIPTVLYPTGEPKEHMSLIGLYSVMEKMINEDSAIPISDKNSIRDRHITFRIRCYRYAFIKEAVDLGHTPSAIAKFLKMVDGSISYAYSSVDRSYTLDDPKSVVMRTIYGKFHNLVQQISSGLND